MKRRCVFLDRDGVINVAPPAGKYILRWDDFKIIPGIVDWIRLFNTLGFLVIVVTNQRAVALGLFSEEDLDEIHERMRQSLAEAGARIDDVYCCPHSDDSCDCRKPRQGLALAAAAKWNIDLSRSLMIGDSERDRGLAQNAGMTYVEVSGGRITDIAGSEII